MNALADKYGLAIDVYGLPALAGFAFESPHAQAYKTLITQEMLKKHYLAGDCIYVCTEHDDAIIDGYIDALDPIFKLIRDCEDGRDVGTLLDGPVCHSRFNRLN